MRCHCVSTRSCAGPQPSGQGHRLADPRGADLPDPLRPARPLPRGWTTYDLLLRDEALWHAAAPGPRPAFRRDADQQAAAQPGWRAPAPTRSPSTPSAASNEPTRRSGGAAARRPHRAGFGWAARAGDASDFGPRLAGSEAERRRPQRPKGDRSKLDRQGVSASPRLHRDPRPARIANATSSIPRGTVPEDARPGGVPYRPGRVRRPLFLCNRGANGIDGHRLIRDAGPWGGAGRRTTVITGDLGLLHDIGGLAALPRRGYPRSESSSSTTEAAASSHFLPQAEALRQRGVRGSPGDAAPRRQ